MITQVNAKEFMKLFEKLRFDNIYITKRGVTYPV